MATLHATAPLSPTVIAASQSHVQTVAVYLCVRRLFEAWQEGLIRTLKLSIAWKLVSNFLLTQ